MPRVGLRAARGSILLRPGRDGRGGQIGILITAPEALRRIVGTVRALERHFEEEWLAALIVFDPLGGGLTDPRRRMQPLGEGVGPGIVIVPTKTRGVGIEMRRLRPEPAPVIAAEVGCLDAAGFVEQALMIAVEVALHMIVKLADGGG